MNTAVPGDTRVDQEEQEKVDKYQDLAREIKRLWKVEATVIPIINRALGTIPGGLQENLRTLEITMKVELIHKVTLLETEQHVY